MIFSRSRICFQQPPVALRCTIYEGACEASQKIPRPRPDPFPQYNPLSARSAPPRVGRMTERWSHTQRLRRYTAHLPITTHVGVDSAEIVPTSHSLLQQSMKPTVDLHHSLLLCSGHGPGDNNCCRLLQVPVFVVCGKVNPVLDADHLSHLIASVRARFSFKIFRFIMML